MSPANLPANTILADRDCRWCSARKRADVHSAACPLGERSRRVQQLDVPWPKGQPLMTRGDFKRTRDYRKYLRRQSREFCERAASAEKAGRLERFISEFRAEHNALKEGS